MMEIPLSDSKEKYLTDVVEYIFRRKETGKP